MTLQVGQDKAVGDGSAAAGTRSTISFWQIWVESVPQSRSLTVPPDICTLSDCCIHYTQLGVNPCPWCDVCQTTHKSEIGFRPVPPVITLDFTHCLCYGNIRIR
jgi:hypothetical protein